MGLLSTKTGLPSFAAADNAIVNYFTDGGFERGSNGVIPTGWAQYNDGAVAVPVDGTGGSAVAQVTMLCTNSSPIRGTLSAVISKDANNRQGVGYSFDFTISNADKGITAGVNFELLTSANYVSGDMVFYIYDVTNSILITPRSVSLPALPSYGKFFSDFGLTTGTSYRFILHIATTSALAYTVTLDTMVNTTTRVAVPGSFSGPFETTNSFIIGSSGTLPTPGTGATYYRRTYREDDYAVIRWEYKQTAAGSNGTGTYTLPLPTGITIDASKIGVNSTISFIKVSGDGFWYNGSTYFRAQPYYNTSTSIGVLLGNETTSPSTTWGASAGAFSGSGNTEFAFEIRVPIAEWSGSGSNFGPGASIEYAATSGTWDAASTTTVYGPGGQALGGALTAGRSKTVTWQNAIQQGDMILVEGSRDALTWVLMNGWSSTAGQVIPAIDSTASVGSGVTFYNSSSTQTIVTFNRYLQIANDDLPATDWPSTNAYWRVSKRSASAPVGQVLASTDGREGLYKAGSAPGLIPSSTTITAAPLAGYIGETLEASGGTLGTTSIGSSGANTSICGVTLTPGVWEVQGGFYIASGATTAWSEAAWGISSTNNGIDSLAKGGWGQTNGFQTLCPVNKAFLATSGTRRFNATTSTPVYLVASIIYSVLGGAVYGNSSYIKAVRIA